MTAAQAKALCAFDAFQAPNGYRKQATAQFLGQSTAVMNQLVAKGLVDKQMGNRYAYFRCNEAGSEVAKGLL